MKYFAESLRCIFMILAGDISSLIALVKKYRSEDERASGLPI